MRFGKRILLKMQRAQKDYKCDCCGETILHSDHYTRATMVLNGCFMRLYCLQHQWKFINADMKDIRDSHVSSEESKVTKS